MQMTRPNIPLLAETPIWQFCNVAERLEMLKKSILLIAFIILK